MQGMVSYGSKYVHTDTVRKVGRKSSVVQDGVYKR